jgi:hypothetical protein
MERNLTSWKTHDWISRRLELDPGAPVILQACRACGRDFVEECSTGDQYAAHVSIFKVHRLSDEVTSRWLSQTCPAKYLTADNAERRTRHAGEEVGSALGEVASKPGLRTVTKHQLEAACAIGATASALRTRTRRLSGAASPKSISVCRAQLVSRPPRQVSAVEVLPAISARLNPASASGGPAGGG